MVVFYFTVAGISLNTIGVLLLFAFGMPFRIPTGGRAFLELIGPSDRAVMLDLIYTVLAWVGLVFVLLGNGLQILSAVLQFR
ncbi:hypothetical protein ATO1_25900 [Phaeobacter sp. 22II1-1F12B]|nr:hypothetical protein ATO1_25900 [Phaeobacter sp. 22II1-1F12B]